MNRDVTAGHLAGVSEREAEVLAALGEHLTNAQIAGRMHISVRTVESHVSSLLRKFGVDDRRALADLAPTDRAERNELAGRPVAWTSFVGRERELASVLAALSESRLVSLVGPGGVGKTRLAVAAADRAATTAPFGGAFVDLVPVREGFVAQAVAAVLGVTEHPHQPLDEVVTEELGRGRMLLVLDNCEHLLDATAAFAERLLAACPELTVLTTSRERLGVPGERTIRVPPLSLVSADTGGPAGSEAEALFLDRALAADPDFTDEHSRVGELCARLDGMPLAIELAAARSASLGVDGLLAGLSDRLQLLAGGRGADHRHRSLRHVIDWSHDLLDDAERALFRRLGVFSGGFDLDGAVSVSPDADRGQVADLIGRLADKSLLVHRRDGGHSRWRLLETVRVYALAKLDAAGEEADLRNRHLLWAGRTADDLERRISAGKPWRDEFDAVVDDLRAALAGAPAGPGPDAVTHRLGRALGHLSYARGFMVEGGAHYRATATRAPHPGQAAADLRLAADVALANMRGDEAFDLLIESARRAETAGDDGARATALAFAVVIADRAPADFPEEVPHERLRDLLQTAAKIAPPGDPVVAAYLAAATAWNAEPTKITPDRDLSAAALAAARAIDDPALISGAMDAVTATMAISGRMRAAFELTAERVRLLDRLPRHDPRAGFEVTDIFHMANEFALMAGEVPAALANARRVQFEAVMLGQPHNSASQLVLPLVLRGAFDESLEHADQMWRAWQRAGRPAARWMAPSVYATSLVHGLRAAAADRQSWRDNAMLVIGGPDPTRHRNMYMFSVFADARVELHLGRLDRALAHVAEVATPGQEWYATQHWYYDAYAWAIAAEVAVVARTPDAAARLAAAEPAGAENLWAAACLDRARGRLGDPAALDRSVATWERIEARFERACTLLLIDERAGEGRAELAALGCPLP
ncbi:MAG TPA: LuxR C-terminal-related transcriptional regulator [Actinophytocola sp.]|uniref:ATP-binding protein n=1 Tax=Actinophytocola sp. TaxID=1872138 RepID=UPI002DBA3848|nr:LuxR C-terminal-related transcriptional regulator [Actinophytocola sp.]HEU5471554.1 LuxR C-terminal-related transcriptional regulator [Actinophytocola sp.]